MDFCNQKWAIERMLRNAMDETQISLDWYHYYLIPFLHRHRLAYHMIDGNLMERRWWFKLKEVE